MGERGGTGCRRSCGRIVVRRTVVGDLGKAKLRTGESPLCERARAFPGWGLTANRDKA